VPPLSNVLLAAANSSLTIVRLRLVTDELRFSARKKRRQKSFDFLIIDELN